MNVTLEQIKQARKDLEPVIKKTDLTYDHDLSDETESEVYLKLENLQLSGSFKIRGAYNKMLHLTDEEKKRGVIASSAGNHAQGVAISAKRLGIKSTIVMPKNAPFAKVSATRRHGAEVVLAGEIYDEAYQRACEIKEVTHSTFVHPFNDPYVIAGQGTLGLELLESQPDLDMIFVPIGGGGIAAGVALAAKSIKPNIKIIGVQSHNAPSMQTALQSNKVEKIKVTKTIADGIAVALPGSETYPLIKQYVDEVVTVTDTQISQAILFLLENSNLVCEGAGAVSVAAILAHKDKVKGKKVAAVLSGGNIDTNLIESIINHAMMSLGRRTEVKVSIDDRPGELASFLETVSNELANIVSIRQSRYRQGLSVYALGVTAVIETIDESHKTRVIQKLKTLGYDIRYTNM